MSVIAFILSAIGFLIMSAGLLGIISPKLMKNRKTGEVQTRGFFAKGLCGGFLFFIIGLIFGGLSGEPENETATAASTPAASTSANGHTLGNDTERKELPLSFEELRQRINKQMAALDTPKTTPIPKNAKPEGEQGAVNYTYQHQAAETLHILISTNPENGNPRGLTIMAAPTGSTVDMLALFAKATAVLAAPAADGSTKGKKLGGKLFEMATKVAEEFGQNSEKQAKDSYSEDGITYHVAITPGLPIMMIASPDK